LTLKALPDGSVAPVGHPAGLVLAGSSALDTAHDLVWAGSGAGKVSLGWRGPLPVPVLSANTATYVDVRPGVDLVVEVTRTGFEQYIVVKSRAAVANLGALSLPWTSGGLTTKTDGAGGLSFTNADGTAAGVTPAPLMWDASMDQLSGDHQHRTTVGLALSPTASGTDLVLTPNSAFLSDPATVFPVTIDPGAVLNPAYDAFVEISYTTDQSASPELRLGTYNGGTDVARSFLSFWGQQYLWGKYVQWAQLDLWQNWSWSCTAKPWEVWETSYVGTAARWTNQPTWIKKLTTVTDAKGYTSSCAEGWSLADVTTAFADVANAGGATTVNLGIRAVSETDNTQWKKFHSMEWGWSDPHVQINYTSKATTSLQTTSPATQCVTGTGRPYMSTTTPTLSAKVTDPDGASVTGEFEWWAVGGAAKIGSTITASAPSGSALSAAVPSMVLANGSNYMWRVRGNDGIVSGGWSPWCEFTVDTMVPSAAPGVSSTAYPENAWAGAAGTAGTFTLSASGVTDVASYVYGLDQNPPITAVNAATLGGTASVTLTPTADGPHTVYVRSADRAGNLSPQTAYVFYVGLGALTAPRPGDVSAGTVGVQALGQPAANQVTVQWRRGDADTWADVPVADVTYAVGGGAVSLWPVSGSGGVFPKLNWNVEATVNAAEAGPDALDGPVQVRASFTGGLTATSSGVGFKLDRAKASAASSNVGAGAVNLATGNLTLSATDVSVKSYGSDLTVARSFNTRAAADTDSSNMFGPGWVSSAIVTDAQAPYTKLTVTGSLVQVAMPDASTIGFSKHDASGLTFDPEPGLESLTLTHATSPADVYTLSDLDGTSVTFGLVTGAPTGTYYPKNVTTAGSSQTTTVDWEKVTIGGVDLVRPTQMLAPPPAGVSCAPLTQGCRAVAFTYAASTTATGTTPTTWGDYVGRVSQIAVKAWDPDATPAAMATVVVAKYAYDSNGRLRQVWDPRLDWTDLAGVRHVDTVYDYDADGIVNTITPAGQQPWQLSYTTVPADAGKGRLAAVTRSALTAGTAVTTVVYRVPVSGTGAPYDMSGTQTARWGQSEPPVDATAIFPPTQVPDGNQSTGTMPSSFERASLSYLDTNGRTVNDVAPGGVTSTTWHDRFGHTVESLSASNRKAALDASATDSSSEEAAIAARLSTINTYSTDGQELRDVLGPEHDMVLPDASLVRGRTHTVTTYDEGAPGTGGPWHLPTTRVVSAQYTNAAGTTVDADARTSTTGYDWTLRQPIIETTDPAGLNYATRTTYDSATGLPLTTTAPAGGVTTNTPATRATVYYRAGTGSGYTECDNHPEWANLPCRVGPGGQAATGPELPVTVTTYDLFDQPRVVTEKTSAGTLRTTTTTYDSAARVSTVDVVGGAGTGVAVAKRQYIYDAATGLNTRIQSLSGSTVTAENIRGYDSLGRLISYTDADTNAATFTYDIASRPATVYDGKATRTYSYDGGSERRGLATTVVDTQTGTFTGSYDTEGRLTSQTWPNGLVVASSFDETGTARSLSYTMPTCGAANCTLYAESVADSTHGQRRVGTSTLSAQAFSYDTAGRLSSVADNAGGDCNTRIYGFNTATDRTSLTSYSPSTVDRSCQTTTGSTTTWTYDTADRVNTTGYVYDSLGRTTTIPAADTSVPAGGNLTATYHVNDLVRTLTQGTRTTTYTLDVNAERVRSWTDNVTGTTVTKTNHYTGDSDSPAWTDEGSSISTRVSAGLAGVAAITIVSGTTATDWQIANLHGDLVATIHTTDIALTATNEATEYGQMRDNADIGIRYAWLGTKQRAADTPTGVTLMGVRVYNPALGRFAQVDPIYGGSANRYDYVNQDASNDFDLTGRGPCRLSYKDVPSSSKCYRNLWMRHLRISCRRGDRAACKEAGIMNGPTICGHGGDCRQCVTWGAPAAAATWAYMWWSGPIDWVGGGIVGLGGCVAAVFSHHWN
jgi:RHS repeat-associated protein